MKILTTKKNKDGTAEFYYGKKNITLMWMGFFSGLSMKDEKRCVELFLKKYGRILK